MDREVVSKMLAKIGTGGTSQLVELDRTLRRGSCVWRAGRNLGAGDGWRGWMEPGDEGVGNRGEEPSECGKPSRGAAWHF